MQLNNISQIEKAINHDEDYKKARLLILKELRNTPDDAWLINRLSVTYFELGDYKKALELSKQAHSLSPSDPLYIWDYAGSLVMSDHIQEATDLYKKILRKGLKSVAFGKGGEGLRWARELINDSRYLLGLCYGGLENYPLAIRWIRKHLKHHKIGTASIYNAKKVKKTLADFEREHSLSRIITEREDDNWVKVKSLALAQLKKTPNDSELLTNLSNAYGELGHYQKALEASKRAYKISPDDTMVILDYAGSLVMSGHEQKAIELYKKILRKGLKSVASGKNGVGLRWARELINDSRYLLGHCYSCLENYPLAIRWIRKHLKHRKIGTASIYNAKKVKKTLADFEREHSMSRIITEEEDDNWVKVKSLALAQLKKTPNDSELLTNLSNAYGELGHYQKALEASKRAYKISPDDTMVIWNYGIVLTELHRELEAIKLYKTILKIKLTTIAEGNSKDDLSYARKIVNDTRYFIGSCYEDIKDYGHAKIWHKKFLAHHKLGVKTFFVMKDIRKNINDVLSN